VRPKLGILADYQTSFARTSSGYLSVERDSILTRLVRAITRLIRR
jgi:hypothetical protein